MEENESKANQKETAHLRVVDESEATNLEASTDEATIASSPSPISSEDIQEEEKTTTTKKREFSVPIVFKQVAVTVGLILVTVIPISHQSVSMFSENSISRARDANRDQVNTRSQALENQLENSLNNVRLFGALLAQGSSQESEKEKLQKLVFSKDSSVASFEIFKKVGSSNESLIQLTNKEFLEKSLLGPEYIDLVKKQLSFPVQAIFSSSRERPVIEVRNASIENGVPLLAVGMPLSITDVGVTTHIIVSYLRLDTLQKLITTDERMIFAVDPSGVVIAHPNDKYTLSRKKLKESEIVQKALSSELRLGDLRFKNKESEPFIGAFAKTKFGITVISQVSEAILLEDAELIRHEAFGIAAIVISIALFFIALFAMTLTAPIEKLELFAQKISKGDFEMRSDVNSRDEVGRLSKAMNNMVDGLIERDKAKSLINKFHGSVGEELMKGELERKGSRKKVTVFFSDIRGFTQFGETHSAEEVVELLNEYFGEMVGIINRNDGVVDKFIGDAIMAIWGAMSENPDPVKAVGACIEMREALVHFNKSREERGLQQIKIGIGLHSGEAIAGTIGSDERMEYTVIGDTVNLAARIEASTKAFGTDLLISDSLSDEIKDHFWLEEAGKAEVKGKSKPITMFKVKGRIINGEKVEVRTAFSEYQAEGADKVKIAS